MLSEKNAAVSSPFSPISLFYGLSIDIKQEGDYLKTFFNVVGIDSATQSLSVPEVQKSFSSFLKEENRLHIPYKLSFWSELLFYMVESSSNTEQDNKCYVDSPLWTFFKNSDAEGVLEDLAAKTSLRSEGIMSLEYDPKLRTGNQFLTLLSVSSSLVSFFVNLNNWQNFGVSFEYLGKTGEYLIASRPKFKVYKFEKELPTSANNVKALVYFVLDPELESTISSNKARPMYLVLVDFSVDGKPEKEAAASVETLLGGYSSLHGEGVKAILTAVKETQGANKRVSDLAQVELPEHIYLSSTKRTECQDLHDFFTKKDKFFPGQLHSKSSPTSSTLYGHFTVKSSVEINDKAIYFASAMSESLPQAEGSVKEKQSGVNTFDGIGTNGSELNPMNTMVVGVSDGDEIFFSYATVKMQGVKVGGVNELKKSYFWTVMKWIAWILFVGSVACMVIGIYRMKTGRAATWVEAVPLGRVIYNFWCFLSGNKKKRYVMRNYGWGEKSFLDK